MQHIHVPATRRRWTPVGDGVALAPLRVHGDGAGAAIIRFEDGAVSPRHLHPGGEDLYVISGRLRVGDVVLVEGDYLHTPPGGVHDAVAEAPTQALIIVPEPVVFLDDPRVERAGEP